MFPLPFMLKDGVSRPVWGVRPACGQRRKDDQAEGEWIDGFVPRWFVGPGVLVADALSELVRTASPINL